MSDDERDHVFEAVALREHARAVEAPVGEIRLQRLNQASFLFGFEIPVQSFGAGRRRQTCRRAFLAPLEIQNGRECVRHPAGRRKTGEDR
jgi:hypothetical protein